jgi:hypothetical protein
MIDKCIAIEAVRPIRMPKPIVGEIVRNDCFSNIYAIIDTIIIIYEYQGARIKS